MPHKYTTPGTYVAICNKTNFDGHYAKVFEYPQSFIDEWKKTYTHVEPELQVPDAGWYFLNRIDFVACLDTVYPIQIFCEALTVPA